MGSKSLELHFLTLPKQLPWKLVAQNFYDRSLVDSSINLPPPAAPVSPHTKPESTPATQTKGSQFMKCNFFNLVVATPDTVVDTPLGSLIACHNAKVASLVQP